MRNIKAGDYVAATKYKDGDPKDDWAIGYFTHTDEYGRYYVADRQGNQFRRNGFRRCERIRHSVGVYMVDNYGVYIIGQARNFWALIRTARIATKGEP